MEHSLHRNGTAIASVSYLAAHPSTAPAPTGSSAATFDACSVPKFRISFERLRRALLWLTAFSGAFVFIQPGPYEAAATLTILAFASTGLVLHRSLVPLVFLLAVYNIGFWISAISVVDTSEVLTWVLISLYLSGTAVFFAAMLGINTKERLSSLFNGYLLAAIVASVAGILGYFNLAAGLTELFVLFGRARGTFNDPNVLGAFLVLPTLLALQFLLVGGRREAVRGCVLLVLFSSALLFSFSRGAWFHFAFSASLMTGFMFVTSRSGGVRLRIVVLSALSVVALVVFVATLLSIEHVAELFQERATFDQSHDLGETGRFGRYLTGLFVAIENPFGIGPLQFRTISTEDPHNTYLNSFLSGGWLSGFSYAALMTVTLLTGLRFVFVTTPWQSAYIATYAAFVGCAAESVIIDSDHWRHYFLLLGVLWGLMAVSRPYLAHSRANLRASVVPPWIARRLTQRAAPNSSR